MGPRRGGHQHVRVAADWNSSKTSNARMPRCPLLVVSSQPEEDYALRALKSGAAGYVSKQSAPDILVTAVQRVLSGRRFINGDPGGAAGWARWPETARSIRTKRLSNRELQVLQLIASGKTIKEISSDLALSEKTVATYRSRISKKWACRRMSI